MHTFRDVIELIKTPYHGICATQSAEHKDFAKTAYVCTKLQSVTRATAKITRRRDAIALTNKSAASSIVVVGVVRSPARSEIESVNNLNYP